MKYVGMISKYIDVDYLKSAKVEKEMSFETYLDS